VWENLRRSGGLGWCARAGYAITRGIPKSFWDEWLVQNADNSVVQSHLLFAHASAGDGFAHAAEGESVSSGLDPLDLPRDPEKTSDDPRVRAAAGRKITTAPEQKRM
jgi:hypothetical protein